MPSGTAGLNKHHQQERMNNMAEINLEDLLKAKAQENTAAAAPVAVIDQQQEIMQVTQQTETLTPAERKQVEEIKSKIDLMNSGYALQFGSGAQKNMADFSDSLLSQVRTKDSGEVGALLTDLSGKINEFNRKESDSFVKKLPLIGALVSKGETMLASYEKLSTKVDKIQSELEKSKTTMMKDIMLFDALYQKNLEYFKHLELYIRAGEEKLEEMRTRSMIIDAGVKVQAVYMAAAAMGLSCVARTGFDREKVESLLRLGSEESAVAIATLGYRPNSILDAIR